MTAKQREAASKARLLWGCVYLLGPKDVLPPFFCVDRMNVMRRRKAETVANESVKAVPLTEDEISIMKDLSAMYKDIP
jgi:hypothetical protein